MALRVTKQAAPAAPAANKSDLFYDTADNRWKAIDEFGEQHELSSTEQPKNYLINGGFDYAQRQVAGTLTNYTITADRTYSFDRWALSVQASNLQAQQVDTIATPVTGVQATNYLRLLQTTAVSKFILSQTIEGRNGAPLRGRTVRVQFKARRAVAAAMTIRMAIIELTSAGTVDTIPNPWTTAWGANGTDPTWGANLTKTAPVTSSVENGTIVNGAAEFVLGASFTRYGANFTLPTTSKNYIVAIWSNAQIAVNDEFHITEAGLWDAQIPQDWVIESVGNVLRDCQRYYFKTFPSATAPAQNAGLAGSWRGGCGQTAAAAGEHALSVRYPVQMRTTTPTVTLYNPSAANAFARNITGATDSTAASATNASEWGFTLTATGTAAWVKGDGLAIHCQAVAEI